MKYSLILCGAFLSMIACSGNIYALKPIKAYSVVPDTMHIPYEKNTLTTSDGLHLKSWTFLPAKQQNNKTTLVLAYADAGNMSWWAMYASILSQSGYTVLLFDYRGFGESDPFPTDEKMLYYNEFTADLSAAIDFSRKQYPGNKTGVWCFSMGSIIATLSAQTTQPDFIIGDSYIVSPIVLQEFYAQKNDVITLPPRADDYANALLSIKAPMLIFSGTTDKIAPPESIKQLKKRKADVSIVSYNGGHLAGFGVLSKSHPGSEYIKAIGTFLKIK